MSDELEFKKKHEITRELELNKQTTNYSLRFYFNDNTTKLVGRYKVVKKNHI